MVTMNKVNSKKEFTFNSETYASLSDFLGKGNTLSMPVAYASKIVETDSNTIAFQYQDTAIVSWYRDHTVIINTGGFVSKATQEKLNFALQGHGFVNTACDGSGQWLLHLIDTWRPAQENGRPYYLPSTILYDGLCFNADDHTITSVEPRVSYAEYEELFAVYKALGGGSRKISVVGSISLQEYDRLIDKIVKQYINVSIAWDNINNYNDDHVECHVCDEYEEIIERSLDEGVIKFGAWGSIKEQCLGLLRDHDAKQHTDDANHLLQHVKEGKYNSSIVWVALTIAQLKPEFYMYQSSSVHYSDFNLNVIRKQVSRFLRRMLHKGIVNVA